MNNKPLNWSWYYPYSDAPLINDIIQIYEVQCEKSPLKFTITDQLKFILPSNSLKLTKRKPIFKDEIYKIADVHSLQLNLYDLDGTLLKTSRATFTLDTMQVCIRTEILNELSNTAQHHYIEKSQENGETFQSSYSYITDQKSKPLAILNLPYLENDEFLSKELNEFLLRLLYAYSFVLLMAVGFAFLLSNR